MQGSDLNRHNNFALVRVILAALVVVSHSPEIIDGNRSREIGTLIWGYLSFGEMAVDGFFLVSGYLITQSFATTGSFWRYLWKRVLRIYPAFVVAFLFCLLIVAPIAGARPLTTGDYAHNAVNLAVLVHPEAEGAFAALPYPDLNGPMWSIAVEFRCYLLIAVLGVLGLLRWRAAVAIAGVLFLVATGLRLTPDYTPPLIGRVTGDLFINVRMAGHFLIGAAYFLHRDKIPLDGRLAAISAVCLFGLLYIPQVAELALALFGGYIVFWFVFRVTPAASAWLRDDISYGAYLYAWPIQSLLVLYGLREPLLVTILSLIAAGALGWLSWRLIERPALSLKATTFRRTSAAD